MQAIVSNTAIKMIEGIFSPFPKIIGIGLMRTITPEVPDVLESMPPIPTRTIPMKIKLRPIRKSLNAKACGASSPRVIMFLPS
jgi:hypothetical protein